LNYNPWDADAASEIRKRRRHKRLKLEISLGLRKYVIKGLINIYRVVFLQKLLKKRDKNFNFYLSFFKN